MVTADKRKGKVVLFTSEDDSLTHFQWHDREKNEVVIDLIVINDAYLERNRKVYHWESLHPTVHFFR